jgi:drug/metabolite transporter (DMT)-like permease
VLAAALALASSLIYGGSDFLGGLKSRSLPLLSVLLVSQGSALVVLAVVVAVRGEGPPGGEFILYAALAGLSEAVGVAALYRGLAVGVMSIVAPVASTAPVVAVVAAIPLGELPSPGQGAGIALAVAGVVLITWCRSEHSPAHDVGPSVLFGLLTAAGFGGFLVAIDAAAEGDVAWALFVARLAAVIAFIVVFLARRRPLAVTPAEVPVLALIGVLIIAADALFAVATTKGLLSVVAVLGSLYPIVTMALARVFLNERIDRLQRFGAAVALSGAVAISVVPS